MTVARFDPRQLAAYDKAPPLLHLQFGDRVHRYVRVEDFSPAELDQDTRRTACERELNQSHTEIACLALTRLA